MSEFSKQIFSRWRPAENIDTKLYIEKLCEDSTGLHLELAPPGLPHRRLHLHFDNYLAYRTANEGDLLKTIGPDMVGATLFIVEHSEFLDWFIDQTLGVRSADPIQHYAIYTPDNCVDVLSLTPPNVWWQS